jgi:hypothetical protein
MGAWYGIIVVAAYHHLHLCLLNGTEDRWALWAAWIITARDKAGFL